VRLNEEHLLATESTRARINTYYVALRP